MNKLFALSLLLASQASFALCEFPQPELTAVDCKTGCTLAPKTQELKVKAGNIYCIPENYTRKYSAVIFEGGELRVCGVLKVTGDVNFNSGGGHAKMSVGKNASFTTTQSLNLNDCELQNLGEIVVNRNIKLQNNNSKFINNPSGTFFMNSSNTEMIVNSSNGIPGNNNAFYNSGKAFLNNIRVNDAVPAGVCMDNTHENYMLCVDEGLTVNRDNFFSVTAASAGNEPCMYAGGMLDLQNIDSFADDVMLIITNSTTDSRPKSILPSPSIPKSIFKWGKATAKLLPDGEACAPSSFSNPENPDVPEDPADPPLPVTFVSAEAKMNDDGDVDVKWKTSAEVNNDKFEIERSDNARDFNKVGEVVNDSGDSNSLKEYSYKDEEPSGDGPFFYYRIKQLDKDGAIDYGRIMQVKNDPIEKVVFANPQKGGQGAKVKIDITAKRSKDVTVKLVNMNGQTVGETKQKLQNNSNSLELDAPAQPGTYILLIDNNDGTQPRTEKILINN